MEKKKILFVVHQLNHGGVQKALLSALDAMDYERNEVTLYIRKNRIDLLDHVNSNVKQIVINQDTTHYYRKPYMVWQLLKKIIADCLGWKKQSTRIQSKIVSYLNDSRMEYERKHYFKDNTEFDVAISYIQGYTARFVAKYVKAKKKVMFYHGSTDETHELHEEVMPYFDKIVGVNAGVQKVLEGLYPATADKMTYIENYVDAENVRGKSQALFVSRKGKDIVLCSCGRLTPVKGFDIAVEVAKILKEKGIDFLWYFVGDGPERVRLENMIAAYELGDNIQITGMQDNPYPYMRGCDIYVQPSREEAHSLTIAEALILEKPVVTTKTVGGQVLVTSERNGFIAEIQKEALAKQVLKMISDNELRNNIGQYLSEIDYSDSFQKYQEAWERLLED